ncbi:MAG: 50S ribosomal protein L35ae [Aeropyrum sp.]|nr:50S ribosomal protein L35ae [Aeropyrum sp.]
MEANSIKGVIMGYARGTNTQYTSYALVKVLDTPERVGRVLGGIAIYKDKHGNSYRGRILKLHGRRGGVVLVRFNRGLPGQAIGGLVYIEPPSKTKTAH